MAGIVRHRLSANQIVKCFKLKKLKAIWGIKLIVCLHWRYKKYHAILGYAVKYPWHICCRIFYFWLVWLINLNTGGPLLHCTFSNSAHPSFPHCFCCLVSLTDCIITPYLMCYFAWNNIELNLWSLGMYNQLQLAVNFMQQGIKFTEGLIRMTWF